MLLSLYHHQQYHCHYHYPSLPPKTPTNNTLSPFPISKTLSLQNPTNKNPSKPTKSLIRSSIPDSQTLPQSAIQRIAEKLRSLGFTDPENPNRNLKSASAGEIFIPLSNQLPKYRVGHTLDTSWSTPESPVPEPGSGKAILRFHELRREWKREKEKERLRRRGERVERVPSLAELSLVPEELRRLTRIGIELRKKLKVGRAGITEGIVNGIHERWRRHEVVKIVCEDICRLNMKRTHDLLERKTGGMVVWRSGSKIILYRGANYKYPYFLSDKVSTSDTLSDQDIDNEELDQMESPSTGMDGLNSSGPSPTNKKTQPALIQGVGSPNRVRFVLPGEAELLEEADRLLDGLGPRFNDWWGYEPLPVDGDLLPAIIPGYRRPFRLLPYGVQPKLTNAEMTTLRRLGRPLRCHFVLGRNRKLHGLAAAIVKLWEKCEIAKIAVKRGVQNTNSELMAEELKLLTGGTLLSRDKEFIVFYRGKDFLPSVVSSAIEERRKHVIYGEKQSEECSASSKTAQQLKLGIIKCDSKDEFRGNKDQNNIPISELKKLRSTEAAIERTSTKLTMALEKKAEAEKLLAELQKAEIPQQQDLDKEGITEEERYMLRKVGLRLKPFLLMGRRGAFAGTIENMHLHWKYRELVKVICKERSIEDVNKVAQTLEVESGGVLVAVERVSKGYAIIVYRGKNYERPASLRPQTLLNKRQAMKRSLEAQRRESLKLHVLKLTRNIDELKLQLDKEKEANSEQSIDKSRLFMAGEKHGADSSSIDLNNGMDDTINSIQGTQQDKLVDLSLSCDGTENQFKSLPESVCEETHDRVTTSMQGEGGAMDSTSCPNNFLSEGMRGSAVIHTEHCASDNEPTESSVRSGKSESEPSDPMVIKTWSNEPMGSSVRSAKSESEPSDPMVIKTGLSEPMESSIRSAKSESEPSDPMVIKIWSNDAMESSVRSAKRELELSDPMVIKTGLIEPMESSVRSAESESELSDPRVIKTSSNEMTSRAVHLSNRDRLLLRKQALKMKKRPVLAVGRSNIVTGIAKQIKAHFERHPLAIVNIKGRAKGTSVQEVVFKLEQATGAFLVSQEPSKVILYRGWGAGDEPRYTDKKNAGDVGKTSAGRAGRARPAVSRELMAAIKLECGLQRSQEEGASPEAGT